MFINIINPVELIKISQQLVKDIESSVSQFKSIICFKTSLIFKNYPNLTHPSNYHQVLTDLTIQLHNCQKQIIDTVKKIIILSMLLFQQFWLW